MYDHYVVEAVNPNGVAGEDDRMETGDVITQLFDKPLRGYPGLLKKILSSNRMKPVTVKIAKVRCEDGKYYRPIVQILSEHNFSDVLSPKNNVHAEVYRKSVKKDEIATNQTKESAEDALDLIPLSNLEISSTNNGLNKTLRFRFVGQYPVGCRGSIERISMGIGGAIMQEQTNFIFRPVKFHFGELSLVVTELDPNTGKPLNEDEKLFNHIYPRIASCGRRSDLPRFFAYIVGDTTCFLAKSFVCLVFEAYQSKEAGVVLDTIGNGFERTHFAL
ncbi:hypothetical protein Ciccas_005687 [Cichlidogyrus casuarinus]|uniref:PDZ domain-containing protein n=1 Tax=Cichlidogyrus casuarinus TaxID=1844966 RepID=A0ABD2Q872_9PLAT